MYQKSKYQLFLTDLLKFVFANLLKLRKLWMTFISLFKDPCSKLEGTIVILKVHFCLKPFCSPPPPPPPSPSALSKQLLDITGINIVTATPGLYSCSFFFGKSSNCCWTSQLSSLNSFICNFYCWANQIDENKRDRNVLMWQLVIGLFQLRTHTFSKGFLPGFLRCLILWLLRFQIYILLPFCT